MVSAEHKAADLANVDPDLSPIGLVPKVKPGVHFFFPFFLARRLAASAGCSRTWPAQRPGGLGRLKPARFSSRRMANMRDTLRPRALACCATVRCRYGGR